MNLNKVPFIRDNKWLLTPILYVSVLVLFSVLFLYKNSQNNYVDYDEDSILGIELHMRYPEINEKLKYKPDSKEFALISRILNKKDFQLARDSELSLLQNANVAGFYVFNSDYKMLAIGYMSNNGTDCKKLRAITISKLGKHDMASKDDSLSEKLSWKSEMNNYTFFNQFSSQGVQLGRICGYMISSN